MKMPIRTKKWVCKRERKKDNFAIYQEVTDSPIDKNLTQVNANIIVNCVNACMRVYNPQEAISNMLKFLAWVRANQQGHSSTCVCLDPYMQPCNCDRGDARLITGYLKQFNINTG